MGDPTMTPLPEMERVVDYAHSPAKADWLDVFLCGRCRFFVGLASGLSQVAVSFGVPCVYVNWISNVLPAYSAKDVFIPKMFRSESDDRFLSFDEMFDPVYQYLNSNNYLILRRPHSVPKRTRRGPRHRHGDARPVGRDLHVFRGGHH